MLENEEGFSVTLTSIKCDLFKDRFDLERKHLHCLFQICKVCGVLTYIHAHQNGLKTKA